MLTRQEGSIELKKRGYRKDDEPGIWISPEENKLAWWIAMSRENIEFDSKTWGADMTRIKERWKEKSLKLKRK